jgi:hypothetical protein
VVNPARREPLLFLQLLGIALWPLEALVLLLLLAGPDSGPFPAFERLLTWALGAVAPAVLFWKLPPDLWSMLLVQVPLRGRRAVQLRLSAMQTNGPLKVVAAAGAALLLPLLWWLDLHAGLAWRWSPLAASPRLVALLVCVPVLALMQWQWHQLVQSVWMMSRSQNCLDQTLPLTQTQAAQDRLSLGIPLLLLPPFPSNAEPTTSQQSVPEHQDRQQEQEPPTPEAAPEEPSTAAAEQPKQEEELLEELPEEVRPEEESSMPTSPTSIDSGIAVAPEQESEENQGTNLNA